MAESDEAFERLLHAIIRVKVRWPERRLAQLIAIASDSQDMPFAILSDNSLANRLEALIEKFPKDEP